jgi:uncharacterized protein
MSDTRYPWQRALVTGASSGIGEAIARELAPSLRELVVTGRHQARLRALAQELEADFDLDVVVMPADLAASGAVGPLLERLRSRDNPIDLLVSNAGVMASGSVASKDPGELESVLRVDALVPVLLARAALDQMVSRRSGTILQIGSTAALFPQPWAATYAASKSFVHSFFESLHEELRGGGVSVTLSIPGFTRTRFLERGGMNARGIPSWIYTSSAAVARISLDAAAAQHPVVICGAGNRAVALLLRFAPRFIVRRLAGHLGHLAASGGRRVSGSRN